MAAGFSTTLRGYDQIEVDAFVDRVERTLAGSAGFDAVTPEVIEAVTFSTALRGYREDEVDDFLDRAVAELKSRAVRPADAPPLTWGSELVRERAEVLRCAEQPAGQRFTRAVLFGPGYAVDDVDAFVDRIRGTMSLLSAAEVAGVRFGASRRGYDMRAVDEWLDRLRSYLEQAARSE